MIGRAWVAAALAGVPAAAAVLAAVPVAAVAQDPAERDSASVVRGVVIETHGVFEPGEEAGWVARAASALHVTTRRRVIERELLFRPGERFDSARVAETARNLRALGVFRRVEIDSVRTDSGLVIRIVTRDGWSARPLLELSSAAGQTAWAAGLEEVNLLGNAAYGSLLYSDHPDRTALTAVFRQPRLFANRVYLQAAYQERSDGRFASLGGGQPFFSLDSRRSVQVGATYFDGDVLRFVGGDPTPAAVLRRHHALLRLDGAGALAASPGGFLRLGLYAQLRRDDFLDTSLVRGTPFPHTVTAAAGPYVWLSRASFAVVRNFRSFLREEDVDLSSTLIVGAYAAPKLFGYDRTGVGLQVQALAGLRTPGGFAALRALATALYSSAGLDSGGVRLNGTWLVQPSRRHALAVTGQLGWVENPVPGEEFDLGLGRGPRAFSAHAFTGDRLINVTAEYRWTLAEEAWQVLGIGLAAFADYGGAWFDGSPRRTGADAGVGLRLGPSRSPDGGILGLDLARRFATDRQRAGWVLVLRKGVRY